MGAASRVRYTNPSALHAVITSAFFIFIYAGGPALLILGPVWLLFSRWWWIAGTLLPLYIYLSFDGSEYRTGKVRRHLIDLPILRPIWQFFGMSLQAEAKLDPSKQYVFAMHPHGNLAFNRALVCFDREGRWNKAFPGIETRTLAAHAPLYIPFIREIFMYSDCVSADRKVADRVLEDPRKLSVILYPGGESEQLMTMQNRERVHVKDRLGFVKMAIHHGTPIVPIYIFGTSEIWHTFHWFYSLRKWICKKFRVALPLFTGRWMIPLVPNPVRLTAVAGPPIEVPHFAHPSSEEVHKWHKVYTEALVALFDRHKVELGYGDRHLELH